MVKRSNRRSFRKRRGIVLVVALLLMAVMSIIGVTAISTSNIDIKISDNTKKARLSFFFADGGLETTPKFIRYVVDEVAVPTAALVPNVTFDDPNLKDEIYYGKNENGDDVAAVPPNSPDIQMNMNEKIVYMDVDRDGETQAPGMGVEFASGAEGIGQGAGAVWILYTLESVANFTPTAAGGTTMARANIEAYYRYVYGVAGGK